MRARELAVGPVPCLALRVTYVGELGWELYCPTEFGARALGHDLGGRARRTASSPAATGRSTRCGSRRGIASGAPTSRPTTRRSRPGSASRSSWTRASSSAARRCSRAQEPERAAPCLVLDDPRAVALGSEPVRVDGAARGPGHERRLRLHGRALDRVRVPAAGAADAGHPVEVEIFGEWVAGEVAAEPLFDPAGERIRGSDESVGGRAGLARTASTRSSRSAAGSRTTTSRSRSTARRSCCGSAGKDTALLGIDREVEHGPSPGRPPRSASGPRSSRSSSPRATWSRASSRARPCRSSGCASRTSAARRGCAARDPRRPADPGRGSTRSASSRSYATTALARGVALPGRLRRAQAIADRIERARGPRAARRATTTCWPRTSSTTASGSGSSTGSTRAWATAPSTWPTSPSTTSSTPPATTRAARRLLGGVARPRTSHARLMRFMSDFREAMWGVVQQARLGARVRLRGATPPSTSSGCERTAAEPGSRSALEG